MNKPNIIRSLWLATRVTFTALFALWVEKRFTWWEKPIWFIIILLFWWAFIPYYAISDFKRDAKRYQTKVETVKQ